jgi:serine/threonine-protein kinase SRPK3
VTHLFGRRRHFALKVCVADADPQRELDVFRRLSSDEGRHVLRLHDSFTIDGPNGTHAVHVFNVLGSLHTIAPLARTYWNPRELCREVAQGMAFLHRHGVVHGG